MLSKLLEQHLDDTNGFPKYYKNYFNFTDVGNAERFVALYRDQVLWEPTAASWYVWNGKYWKRDGDVMPWAKATVQTMLDQEDTEKWGLKSQSLQRLKSMIELAKSDVRVEHSRFDTNLWAFNCQNGTVDLRTGELRPHSQGDYITKISPASYEPGYTLDEWEQYLDVVTQGNIELRKYLQKIAGLALVGELREKALFIVQGPRDSGKTVFLEALRAMFGDYAVGADFAKTFDPLQRGGSASPELARLNGARLVVCSEVKAGTQVAQDLIKRVTGGDPLTARHLFKDYIDFRPQFTLLLVCNDNLKFSIEDSALWSRIKRIPFLHTLPPEAQNKELRPLLEKTEAGWKAVLAWAVEGCLMWQREGLIEPQVVLDATRQYRQELDLLHEWLADCVTLREHAWTSTEDLYQSYCRWCGYNLETPVHIRTFGKLLSANRPGITAARQSQQRGYNGVTLGQKRT